MAVDFPERVVHGGTGKRQQEKTHKTVLDFSASVNPYPPAFAWAMDPGRLSVYPDDSYSELKDRIARVFHRRPEEICVGNGSIELIRVFCSVIFRDALTPRTFFQESPTFGEYALSARLAGAVSTGGRSGAAVSFLCNPNNPTGRLTPKAEVLRQLCAIKGQEGMLFVDEAFIELADPGESMADIRDPSLFVLRSLTKSFSVPGIRFGYGFGDPALIEKIEIARPPWSVNAYAEAYAMEALLHHGRTGGIAIRDREGADPARHGDAGPWLALHSVKGQLYTRRLWQGRCGSLQDARGPGDPRPRLYLLRPADFHPRRGHETGREPSPY